MAESVRDAVLRALKENEDGYLSGEKISEELGVSRAAVWKAISALRKEGYPIEAVTKKGYLLPKDPARITEDEIRRYLPAKYRNNGIFVYDIIDSTNTRARQIASGIAPAAGTEPGGSPESGGPGRGGDAHGAGPKDIHGTAVIALQQTGGKGRLGRSFFSPREGLYFSIIVRPDFDVSRSTLVTLAAATSVAEAIEEICGKQARIKWVNDVYVNDKKVCGILTEGITDFESGQIEHLVIGIGINTTLKGFPEDLLAVAGAVEGDYSRSALAAGVIRRVLDYLENIESKAFMEGYRQRSMMTGKEVTVYKGVYRTSPEEELSGRPAKVLGIDEDGGLMVIYTDGTRETLITGEVTIRTERKGNK